MKMKGLFVIIESGSIAGLKRWSDEIERRDIPGVVQIDKNYFENDHGELLITHLSNRGFEIGGAYNEKPFWDVDYRTQYQEMTLIKGKMESLLKKPMRIFNSKLFAYDKTTLQVSEALGIRHLLARGANGARAVVYRAEGHHTKIISVSNVMVHDVPDISLCGEAMFNRGISPKDFKETLFSLKEDRIVLIAHTRRIAETPDWWNVYQDFLDTNLVVWKTLDQFTSEQVVIPIEQIPMNRSS